MLMMYTRIFEDRDRFAGLGCDYTGEECGKQLLVSEGRLTAGKDFVKVVTFILRLLLLKIEDW
jgi:hypothetical protein